MDRKVGANHGMIAKKAHIRTNFRRDISIYPRARDAWKAVLEAYSHKFPDSKVLLPSYIGWTQAEGSGIFDPVSNVGISYEFYGLDKYLRIDFEDLKKKVDQNPDAVLLLVHYFGFPDINYDEITSWLDEKNVFYVEDNAHGMLSDWIGSRCGRRGAYSFFSLHKNLPFKDGGMLIDNHSESLDIEQKDYLSPSEVLSYDMHGIFHRRRENYELLLKELKGVHGLELLYTRLAEGISPQSFPVLILDADRDDIFRKMNESGFGLVSLYYHMIEPLRSTDYESVQFTSKHITNRPVHQDCEKEALVKLATALKELLA